MGGSTDALSIDAGMSDQGWLPAWRKLFDPDHDLAPSQRDPASRGWAWIDLCQMAAHKPYTKRGVRLERGEILVAVRYLAPRWWWSKSRVSRFLVQLESGTRIGTVRGTPFGTVYSIVNYDTYATVQSGARDAERDKLRDRSGTAAGQTQPLNHSTILQELGGGGLFANGEPPTPTAVSVGAFCEGVGCEWTLKAGIKEWAASLDRNPRFARLDIPYEVTRCMEHHQGKRTKVKAAHGRIRTWLDNQVKYDMERNLGGGNGRQGSGVAAEARSESRKRFPTIVPE